MDGVEVFSHVVDMLLTWAIPDTPGQRPVEWLVLGILAVAVAAVMMWRRGITMAVVLVPLVALLLMYPPVLHALPVVIALR